MRAAQDFLSSEQIADIDGWVTTGASKRGWTTWLTGVTSCSTCPKVKAIIPMVPVEPNFIAGVHHMWRSYGAFTFFFEDYLDKKIILPNLDSEAWKEADQILDPLHYSKLAEIPKLVVLASNDQFMMFEWTSMWWDMLEGEKYLLIIPNTEHMMHFNGHKQVNTLAWFIKKIKSETEDTFQFESSFDQDKKSLQVQVSPRSVKPSEVILRYAETLSNTTRDFRWNSMPDKKGNCEAPRWKMKKNKVKMCFQPIFWMIGNSVEEDEGLYSMQVPEPVYKDGRWQGVFAEVQY